MTDKRIAMISKYAIEISPTLKSICSYLSEQTSRPVDVIIDDLHRNPSFTSPAMRLFQLKPAWLCGAHRPRKSRDIVSRARNRLSRYAARLKSALGDAIVRRRLKRFRDSYDVIFCIEAATLLSLDRAGFDLSNVVYVSLEGTDSVRRRTSLPRVLALLKRCAFCTIQSKERRKGLESDLGGELDFEYLPVCGRPVPVSERATRQPDARQRPKIVHSGYFAKWSCLREFVAAYADSGLAADTPLYLQGHAMGTTSYLADIRRAADPLPLVWVDDSYYADEEHRDLLARYDIGVALYKNLSGSSNWENLIFSSGKIASYLWAGLAVITNLDAPLTASPPFLKVDEITPDEVRAAVERYAHDRELYAASAFAIAEEHYNFDRCMAKVMARIG